jgi:hypothetical protein
MRKRLFSAFSVSFLTLVAPAGARACSVCGLDDFSYMWSYLFMTAVPLAAMSIIGGFLFYSYRRGNNKPSDPTTERSAKSS